MKRVTCPLCARKVALTSGGLLRQHKRDGAWCDGSNKTTLSATVLLAREMYDKGGQP
jgi:hypothetical protein